MKTIHRTKRVHMDRSKWLRIVDALDAAQRYCSTQQDEKAKEVYFKIHGACIGIWIEDYPYMVKKWPHHVT